MSIQSQYGALAVILLLFVALETKGQTPTTLMCQTCNWPGDGENCYIGNYSSTLACALSVEIVPYCLTTFTVADGIVTAISRLCASAQTDENLNTAEIPAEPSCNSTSDYSDTSVTQTSICYYSCNTNNCNSMQPSQLSYCPISCGPFGTCNYITGECACLSSYTGAACDTGAPPTVTPSFLSCVQCNEEFDTNCRTQTAGSLCDSSTSNYCATSVTTTYDPSGTKLLSTVTRSCTNNFVSADECFISNTADSLYTNEVEYTCVTTCDTNNCNTAIPDGLISSNEALQPVFCLQCTDTDGTSNCATGSVNPTPCPSSQRFCSSTSQYYFSERHDKSTPVEPDYKFISITRGCGSNAITPACTERSLVDSSLKVVKCQETCTTDGCNFRWPARPLCSKCDITTGGCIAQPPRPKPCPFPYQQYCTAIDTNRPLDTSNFANEILPGYTRSVIRDCAYNSIGNTCVKNSYGDGTTENCNKTCSMDGCNLGNVASSVLISSQLMSLIALVSVVFFA